MKFGHGRNQGKTETASWRGAACLETIEAAKHLCALFFWNALTVIEDGGDDCVAFLFEADLNVRPLRRVANGVLDEIGGKLKEQIAVARNRDMLLYLRIEPVPQVLGDRSERRGDELEDLGEIDACETRLACTRLDLCDAQERRE